MDYQQQRNDVAACMTRLYQRGLTTTSGGNISLRLDDGHFCITASAKDKASLTAEDIAVADFSGNNLTPHLRMSIENGIHRLVLQARPDMNAVVHAHSLYASAFSAIAPRAGETCSVDTALIAESWFLLGNAGYVPYYKQGSEALAQAVATMARDYDVLLMENHGVVAVGRTLIEAFDRIEVFENAARMTYITRTLGAAGMPWHTISLEDRKELRP